MLTRFSRILNIYPGEGQAISLLLLFSFTSGLTTSFYYTVSTSFFLTYFDRSQFPVAYIAMGLLSYISWRILHELDKKLPITRQLIFKLGFLSFSTTILISLWQLIPGPTLAFILFIWVRVLMLIVALTFWGLAGKMFDLRQGKRLFGLIASGEVASGMLGFFLIPVLLKISFIKPIHLMFTAGLTLFASFLTLLVIIRKYRKTIETKAARPRSNSGRKKSSLNSLLKSRYFQYVFLLALLPILVQICVDFMFLDEMQNTYGKEPGKLAGFIGSILGVIALSEMSIKTLLSGRIISRYGLRWGLSMLPIALLIVSLLTFFTGIYYGEDVKLFLILILGSKYFERIVRSAIYEPTFQILYQPLPAEERFAFQNQVEGIPKTIGNILGGICLFFFTRVIDLNLTYFNLILALILAFWLYACMEAWKEYRQMLRSVLEKKKADDMAQQLAGKIGLDFISAFIEDSHLSVRKLSKFVLAQWQFSFSNIEKVYSGKVNSDTNVASTQKEEFDSEKTLQRLNERFLNCESIPDKMTLVNQAYQTAYSEVNKYLFHWTRETDPILKSNILQFISQSSFVAKPTQVSIIKEQILDKIEYLCWVHNSLLYAEDSEFASVIKQEQNLAEEEIFLWLSLLYGSNLMSLIQSNLKNPTKDKSTQAYILELIDTFVESDLSPPLLVLLDDQTQASKVSRLNTFHHFPSRTVLQIATEIISSSLASTHSSLISKIEAFQFIYQNSLQQEVNLPKVRSTIPNLISSFYTWDWEYIGREVKSGKDHSNPSFWLDLIKEETAFSEVKDARLMYFVGNMEARKLNKQKKYALSPQHIYWILSGKGEIKTGGQEIEVEKELIYVEGQGSTLISQQDIFLLSVKAEKFGEQMINHSTIASAMFTWLQEINFTSIPSE